MRAVLRHLSDGAIWVSYPDAEPSEANAAAVEHAALLLRQPRSGILDAIPGARTLLILYDPGICAPSELERELSQLGAGEKKDGATASSRHVVIPVLYGGEAGPDLGELARATGFSIEQLIAKHSAPIYRVAFIGFAPGFPYLEGLPPELAMPRLATPRPRVAAGSVAVAERYGGIYPSATPGGWRLLGRTPLRLFDGQKDPPSLLGPGDQVTFEPIEASRFASLNQYDFDGPAPISGEPLAKLISPGMFTSIQGGPRFGYGRFGVPPGGAMDLGALAQANQLLGNEPLAPGLEILLLGPQMEFLRAARFCLSGATFEASLDGAEIEFNRVYGVKAGAKLKVGRALAGVRAYLAIQGGLSGAPPLGHTAIPLKANHLLQGPAQHVSSTAPLPLPAPPPGGSIRLRVILGPQEDGFTPAAIATFFESEFRVSSRSDRRGLRLEGPSLVHSRPPDIPSEGTAPGAIQIPGDGMPIILGPDRPVTGGYAKIATVIGADLPLLAQARPGTRVSFEQTTLEAVCK